ncbi:MAG: hypothetical protein KTR31_20445 [Myxococcales bacterium]|nr:hypothetical protein [Myxococcales bacterium]
MSPDDPRLAQLRRAYETRRWLQALPWMLPVLGLAALAWSWGSSVALALGPVGATTMVWSQWRGGEVARSAAEGLLGSGAAFVLLGVWCQTSTCAGLHCIGVCALAGTLAGVVVSRRTDVRTWRTAWPALMMATLVVALPAGVFGLIGFVAPIAFWGFGVPIAWVLPRTV